MICYSKEIEVVIIFYLPGSRVSNDFGRVQYGGIITSVIPNTSSYIIFTHTLKGFSHKNYF